MACEKMKMCPPATKRIRHEVEGDWYRWARQLGVSPARLKAVVEQARRPARDARPALAGGGPWLGPRCYDWPSAGRFHIE